MSWRFVTCTALFVASLLAANTMAALAKDTNATRYLSNTGASNAPAWDQVELTNGVSGILPAANGGTGANLSAGAIGAVPYFSGAGVMSALAAGTANYLLQANGAAAPSWVQSTDAATGSTIVRRDANGSFSGNVITANSFSGTIAGGSSFIQDTVGSNDYIRVRGGGGLNAGYLEIATADDGTEPIYVRQYTGVFGVVARTATLLDAAGHTTFPGYVYGQYFNMTANANATNPEYLVGEWGGDNFLRYVTPANVTVGNATNAATAATASAVSNTDAAGQSAIAAVNSATAGTINWTRVSKTGSNLTDLATKAHGSLTAIGVNTHAQIDTHISNTGTSAHGATNLNTASQIVARDASGNFSAGTITANLTGNVTGNVTGTVSGNAGTVTNGIYTTTNFVGDVTGTPGATVVGNDSHTHGNGSLTGGASSNTSFTVIVSTQGAGTCRTMDVTNGMVTTISNTFNCY